MLIFIIEFAISHLEYQVFFFFKSKILLNILLHEIENEKSGD